MDKVLFFIEGDVEVNFDVNYKKFDEYVNFEETEEESKVDWFKGINLNQKTLKLMKERKIKARMALFTLSKISANFRKGRILRGRVPQV